MTSTAEPRGEVRRFYESALDTLLASGVPFMVGGAFAMREYAGIDRDTKDLDVFCSSHAYPRLLRTLEEAGYRTEVTDASWLAKAFSGVYFVDIIFSSGNGTAPVDDSWFEQSRSCRLLDRSVRLIPPEELIWSKSTVQDRYRYDGADIQHVILKRGAELDWERVLRRMEPVWEVLLAHLILFRFVYPSDREQVPEWVMSNACESADRVL